MRAILSALHSTLHTPPAALPPTMTMTIMGYCPPPLVVLATATITMASEFTFVSAFQFTSNHCSPQMIPALYHTPKVLSPLLPSSSSTSSNTALCAWNRELNGGSISSNRRRQQRPLRAYTVADNFGKPSWFPFLKFPLPFADVAAQFFGLEGMFHYLGGRGLIFYIINPFHCLHNMNTFTLFSSAAVYSSFTSCLLVRSHSHFA